MASNTLDASGAPEVHAEPAEAKIPLISIFTARLSASTPANAKLRVLLAPLFKSPLIFTSPILDSNPLHKLSLSIPILLFSFKFITANSAAFAKPAIAGIFSVPARRFLS